MYLLTLLSFVAFTGFAAFFTWLITKNDEKGSSDGFFLGGRSLTFPLIAGSLLLTNLSTEQMVGLNGAAFKDGLSVMAWEVIAVIALVLMAIFFLPKFLRTGITTVPEFLELRFDRTTQAIANIVFLAAYAFLLLPIILYTGAVGLSQMLDMQSLTGISSEAGVIWFTVILIGIMGSIYSRFGGLRSLAVLDTINGVGLLIGGLMIAWFALDKVSDGNGIVAGWNALYEKSPERLSSIGGAEQSVPFSTLFTGVALLNLFYWCTNQQIIQRTFGASSLAEGQKGVLLTGALKLLGPIYLVIPGIIAYHLYADLGIKNDQAYGYLVRDLLPPYLTGFFAAVMVGAILSSFNAALNSTSALFSIGVYKTMLNPKGDEQSMVRAAKIFVTVIAIAAMIAAPLLLGQDSIFGYLQKMNGIYFIPIFAVVLMGMLNKRTPPIAATVGLVLGLVLIAAFYFVPACADILKQLNIHDFHFLGIVFAILLGVMQLITIIKPLPEDWTLQATEKIDLTPWRGAKPVSVVLVITVIIIYVAFAR